MNRKVLPVPSMRSVYHITPLENLPSILAAGVLLPASDATPIKNFGDPEIKAKRKSITVAVEPFGNLADYTPFYFTTLTPMLYKFTKNNIKQSSFVIIRLDFEPNNEASINGALSIVISAHPLSDIARTERATAENITRLINWRVITSAQCSEVPGVDLDQWILLRQAELLIHKGISIDGPNIKLVVRTDDALAEVDELIKNSGRDLYAEIDEKLFYHYNLLPRNS